MNSQLHAFGWPNGVRITHNTTACTLDAKQHSTDRERAASGLRVLCGLRVCRVHAQCAQRCMYERTRIRLVQRWRPHVRDRRPGTEMCYRTSTRSRQFVSKMRLWPIYQYTNPKHKIELPYSYINSSATHSHIYNYIVHNLSLIPFNKGLEV